MLPYVQEHKQVRSLSFNFTLIRKSFKDCLQYQIWFEDEAYRHDPHGDEVRRQHILLIFTPPTSLSLYLSKGPIELEGKIVSDGRTNWSTSTAHRLCASITLWYVDMIKSRAYRVIPMYRFSTSCSSACSASFFSWIIFRGRSNAGTSRRSKCCHCRSRRSFCMCSCGR